MLNGRKHKKRFKKILENEGAWERFKKNCQADGRGWYKQMMRDVKNDINVIGGAFIWCTTPEGHAYWSNMQDKVWDNM